ncbi:AraC-like DNA-binding protein [Paenibacillus castaneae]|uniref:AraC family transcriptional regulator n=1 Tax=Paenibacillus castaneae TaxID=474957 RepID=UPI000C9C733D|nr:AraC family transcriptional regulator [Paenibacillus castaneae]NIK75283.1 AraC-like DNA-binding protein [Paenibacillus castaneae]
MTLIELEHISPTVNFAVRQTAEAGENWGIRVIPDCQILNVISGQAELYMDKRVYTIRDGECIYYGPECQTYLSVSEKTEFFSIHFDWQNPSPKPVHPGHGIQFTSNWPPIGAPNNPMLVSGPSDKLLMPTLFDVPGLEPIWTRMVKEYKGEQPGYALALRALMMQAITHIFRQLQHRNSNSHTKGRIDSAIQAIQGQPGRNWLVTELAALCGYHPIHFSKLFKEELGLTPKHFMIKERIKWAKQALLLGEKMESISLRLGFRSIHYFSHQFKEVTGLTPSQYRMQGWKKE